MALERILRAVENQPWMIAPSKLEQITQILIARSETGSYPEASDIEAMEARQRDRVASRGAVAVMPLFGTISRRMGMLGAMSGGASIETFANSFDEVMRDDSVSAVLIDIDSPGGSVYGVEELSRKIFDARKHKRIVAVADQLMASAAYYIGSAADELIVTPSGEVGSIGVYTVHFDWSEHLEKAGIKATIIKAGEHKAEGNPYEILGEDAAEHVQMMVDDYYDQFVRAVARNRKVSVAKVRQDFGGGRTFTAKRALERGMVDRIATMDQVIDELRGAKKSKPASEARRRAVAAAPVVDIAALALDERGPTAHLAGDPENQVVLGEVIARATEVLTKAFTSSADLKTGEGFEVLEDVAGEVITAAGGLAATEGYGALTETAPSGQEESVNKEDTAVQGEGAAQTLSVEDAIKAERERAETIRSIASVHNIDDVTASEWISSGASVDAVNAAALGVIKERNAAGAAVQVVVGADREAEKPYEGLGGQLLDIVALQTEGISHDVKQAARSRLMGINAAATGAGEAVPSDGGFLIQPDLSADILRRVYDIGQVASRVRRRPVGPNSNGLKLRAIDESSRVNGSRYGGVQAFWADEADTVTAKKPKFRIMDLVLHKLLAIMYATEELLEDSVALQGIAEDAFAEEINFKVEDAIFRGTGAGQPLGFLNSACLVSVTKESAQVAATFNETNAVKMYARMWPRSVLNAAWLINQDVQPQLPLMTIGNQPVYLPPGRLADSPLGTLLGAPVIPVEYCPTLGTKGDVCLVDLDQYLLIDKGGPKASWSIHVRFINDEQTFKITYRCDGQPTWNKALTPFQGSNTLSPFVVLDTRS